MELRGFPSATPLLQLLNFLLLVATSCRYSIAYSSLQSIPDPRSLTTSTSQSPAVPDDETSILLAFRSAISYDPLDALKTWTSIPPSGFNHCSWSGVVCSPGTSSVSALLLGSKQLHGSVTPRLSELPHLAHLDLSDNRFNGTIPRQLTDRRGLTYLDLSNNSFTGSIPDTLVNCIDLTYLDLSTNHLQGPSAWFLPNLTSILYVHLSINDFDDSPLPTDIGLLSNLQYLQILNAHVTGEIPLSITNCTKLVVLDLSMNNLVGSIPSQWSKLVHLTYFSLYENNLVGEIADSLSNCTALENFGLEQNELTGPAFPSGFGRLANLRYLKLFSNKLSGGIPPFIGNFSNLVYLSVSQNNLSGTIPQEIGQLQYNLKSLSVAQNENIGGTLPDSIKNCSSLSFLKVSQTRVYGSLSPAFFDGLTSLSTLTLSSSLFSGPLPREINKLTQLEYLILEYNSFDGQIPQEIGELQHLQAILLGRNRFAGSIPAELGNCTQLVELDLSQNKLTGYIPSSLGNLKTLNILQLNQNGLSGSIPESLGSLIHLSNLSLSQNNLTGPIPGSLADGLRNLALKFDLSQNQLGGVIPSTLGLMIQVEEINLAANKLRGEIPAALENCVGLQTLNLSRNNLEGQIPENLGGLESLVSLDLSNNAFSGDLPSSLESLQYLESFNVSFNQLTGPIPTIGAYQRFPSSSYLENPGLCGQVIGKRCTVASSVTKRAAKARLARTLIISLLSSSVGVVSCAAIWWYRSRSKTSTDPTDQEGSWLIESLEPGPLKRWAARQLKAATQNFSPAEVIGTGGVSVCYRGVMMELDECPKVLAVKKFNETEEGTESHRSFIAELKALSSVRHKNVVRLLGYCNDEDVLALVLEYVANGTLDENLHPDSHPNDNREARKQLSWEERLNIALDVVQGLVYIHHECAEPVVHCDLKPRNILLGSNMVARIADFGTAKPTGRVKAQATRSTTTMFRGTFGYAAPELGGVFSSKVDAYSYGVVLLELVTGRRPTTVTPEEGSSLVSWVRAAFARGRSQEVVDLALLQETFISSADLSVVNEGHGALVRKQMEQVLHVGLLCTRDRPKDRPRISLVRDIIVSIIHFKMRPFLLPSSSPG